MLRARNFNFFMAEVSIIYKKYHGFYGPYHIKIMASIW